MVRGGKSPVSQIHKKKVKTMTLYQINYENRLTEMLDQVIQKYGFEHRKTIIFARYVEKYRGQANYQNRETMEQMFKGLMK